MPHLFFGPTFKKKASSIIKARGNDNERLDCLAMNINCIEHQLILVGFGNNCVWRKLIIKIGEFNMLYYII